MAAVMHDPAAGLFRLDNGPVPCTGAVQPEAAAMLIGDGEDVAELAALDDVLDGLGAHAVAQSIVDHALHSGLFHRVHHGVGVVHVQRDRLLAEHMQTVARRGFHLCLMGVAGRCHKPKVQIPAAHLLHIMRHPQAILVGGHIQIRLATVAGGHNARAAAQAALVDVLGEFNARSPEADHSTFKHGRILL